MKYKRIPGRLAALSIAIALAGTTLFIPAYADDVNQNAGMGDAYAMGPGMMNGYGYGHGYGMGPGMMNGYGHGYGMGPGMMNGYGHGYGMGPGMMNGYGRGYGMGPGMMYGYGRGYGMGPGMMGCGGYGMGGGMMGLFWGHGLGLTDAQRSKIEKIMEETRKSHWAMMGAMMDQRDKLSELYAAPKQDDAAIKKAYHGLSQLRQQMFDSMLDAQKRMESVLTKEQMEKLHSYRQRGW